MLIKVNTGGVVKAQKLQTTDTEVRIRAGGRSRSVMSSGLLTYRRYQGGRRSACLWRARNRCQNQTLLGGRVSSDELALKYG